LKGWPAILLLLVLALLLLINQAAWAKPTPGSPQPVPAPFKEPAPESIADLRLMEKHVEHLIQRTSPAVVSVRVGNSLGSAVVITPDGLVLCAAHVCGEPGVSVHFTFPNGRTAHGKTLGTDHDADAALMKITDEGPWPYVDLAAPSSAHVGDWVIALGHPGGFDSQRSVVARLGRVLRTGQFVQTDCTLIGGDSGGPLFDVQGHVVGIHSRISEDTSENFHVPVRRYFDNWDRLMASENWGGRPHGGFSTIGVRGLDDPSGCRLKEVIEDGPAARAGLAVGDIITHFDSERITNSGFLSQCVRQKAPGDEITLLILRDGSEFPVRLKVGALRPGGPRRP
jgi:serine protease Do